MSLIALTVLTVLYAQGAYAAYVPDEIRDGVDNALDMVDLSAWDSMFYSLPEDIKALWGGMTPGEIVGNHALGEAGYMGPTLQSGLPALLKGALPDVLPVIVSLLVVAILTGVLKAMSESGMSGLNDIVGLVCQCFAIGVAMASFLSMAVLARNCIAQVTAFIEMASPVLITLLTALGGVTTSGIIKPAMAMLSSGVSFALQHVVMPVILVGGVLGVLNNITGRVQLGQLFQLSKTAVKWMIGFLFTLYFAITSLQGLTVFAFDSVSIRTAKFAIDKFIPIVGGMVSGTVDTVLGCILLVKNAVGLAAIILSFTIICVPLTNIAMAMLAFRLAAGVCEPIADPRLPKMLASLADVLTYLFAAVVSLFVMFVITVALIMGAGGTAIGG
ncbi:MAG: stage III sporulation protein AE [Clostridiales bacterium]|nr:stage III sporulation protein AE [Clostridiales bacterium]